jgi:hypothetical protein
VDLVRSGLAFAAAVSRTGAYISLSCYYAGAAPGTPVPVLSPFGTFELAGQGGDCLDRVHVIPHAAVAGLTDEDLSNWGCSVHETFTRWPESFVPVAISLDSPSSFVAEDGSTGAPYILARTSSPRAQTIALLATVKGAGMRSLVAQLEGVLAKIDRKNTSAACGQLKAFRNHVRAQSGKRLPVASAAALRQSAADIASAIGCR